MSVYLIILFHFIIVVSLSSFFGDFFVLALALALVFMSGLNIGLPFLRSLLKTVLLLCGGCRLCVPSVCAFACVSVSSC